MRIVRKDEQRALHSIIFFGKPAAHHSNPMRYGIFRTIRLGLAAPNLAELEVAKRNQASEREPPCQTIHRVR